jgi:8-oxo-dGTP pyrophosphatase MutT (NUDIX family)
VVTANTVSTFLITCGGIWRVGLARDSRRGRFRPVGGDVDVNETAEDAAVRQVREKAGIPLRRLVAGPSVPLPGGFPYSAAHPPWWTTVLTADPDHHAPALHTHVDAVYVAVADTDLPETDTAYEVRWFTSGGACSATEIDDDSRLQARAVLDYVEVSERPLAWPGKVYG